MFEIDYKKVQEDLTVFSDAQIEEFISLIPLNTSFYFLIKNELIKRPVLKKEIEENKAHILNRFLCLGKVESEDTELEGVEFDGIDIHESSFKGSILKNVKITHSNISFSDFEGTQIIDSIFTDNKLMNSKFMNSNFEGTKFDNSFINESNFEGSNLTNTSFKKTTLNRTVFLNCKLTNANFENSKSINAIWAEY